MKKATLLIVAAIVVTTSFGIAAAQDRFPYSVASGDPQPDSVILWTKVHDPDMPDALMVEVATDMDFANIVATRQLTADAMYDYAVKVRISGLTPYTTYYYRFVYGSGAMMDYSTVGRTRTAPAPDSTQPVRFAVIYCQDYIGRYYNTLLKLLRDHDEDIDFVVHLGDVVYETTGDPGFQNPGADRSMVFDDTEGAILLGSADAPYYGAASLSNYRTLYATYRTDRVLQQVHERWPMIAIWDDHEFSDDSWGATATYFDGRKDEYDTDRRQNAEQAFFEWVPIAAGLNDDGELGIDASMLYPNTHIYRDFHFGSLLHMVMTDYRTFRPDHIIPEDAFPGTVVVDEPTLVGLFGQDVYDAVKSNFDPYTDLDALGLNVFRQTIELITANAYMLENPELDLMSAIGAVRPKIRGMISATIINLLFQQAGLAPPFNEETLAVLPRGVSYLYAGKQSMYGSTGSRYLVMNDTYEILAAAAGAEAQNPYGGQQMAWLQGVISQSPAMWTVLGSSVSMAPMIIDFTNPTLAALLPPEFPDQLRTRLKLNVDQWDGFPHMRSAMLDLLRIANNPIVISGDIHATFVSDHGGGVFEFTPPAVSSATFGTLVANVVRNNPMLGDIPGMEQLIAALPFLLQVSANNNPALSDIAYTTTSMHGFAVMDANEETFNVRLMEIAEDETFTSYYETPDEVDDLFIESNWTVRDGELERILP